MEVNLILAEWSYSPTDTHALASVIAHEELAASDPAFCLSYLAHSLLFVNNLTQVATSQPTNKPLLWMYDGGHI